MKNELPIIISKHRTCKEKKMSEFQNKNVFCIKMFQVFCIINKREK